MDPDQLSQLRHVASVLLPGDADAPAAIDVAGFDDLLQKAVDAIGVEGQVVMGVLDRLDDWPTWDELRAFAESHPNDFEVLSTVAAGAYFMSTHALDAIGYHHGPRSAPRIDLAADQLSGGILDVIAEREPMVRAVP